MGKPIADVDTYVYGTSGIVIAAAKNLDNETVENVYVYKQYSANSFILQDADGVIIDGKFTLTGFLENGEPIDTSLSGNDLALTLPMGTCCIVYDNGEAVKPCVVKMFLNKIFLNNGSVVFNNAVQ